MCDILSLAQREITGFWKICHFDAVDLLSHQFMDPVLIMFAWFVRAGAVWVLQRYSVPSASHNRVAVCA